MPKAGVGISVSPDPWRAAEEAAAGALHSIGRPDAALAFATIEHGDPAAETEVVVRVGGIRVIVTQIRKPYHRESDFTNLGLDPRDTDIVVVKIGYLVPELYDMRGDWIMALTPGGVDQDLDRLDYQRIQRPMFPLDADMEDPDLSARLIPLSNQ